MKPATLMPDTPPASLDELRRHISAMAFVDEAEAVKDLLNHTTPYRTLWPSIHARAALLVDKLRNEGLGLSVEAFLQEYGLSSKEGVAVMCLAEALLRIPDRETANRLIESTFDGAQWEKHIGKSDSLYVNASSWGLLLTGKIMDFGDDEKHGAGALIRRLVHGTTEPVIREALKSAMRLIASQFVMGETIKETLKKAPSLQKKGYRFSYDMLGEGARSAAQAQRYFESYQQAIAAIAASLGKEKPSLYEAPSISIKLTALHPRYHLVKRERVMHELLPRLKTLVTQAMHAGICVAIDAEEATRLDLELELFEALFTAPEFSAYHGIGFVLQAYQKRAIHVIDFLAALTESTTKRIPIRLVKGAYWDSELKAAQLAGLEGYPVFTVKAHSDLSYLACAQKLLAQPQHFYPQFATHNALTVAAIEAIAQDKEYEFQKLYGMGDKLYESVTPAHPCRIYAPVGEHRDLLAYLIRRLLENGANSSFIHLLMNKHIGIDTILGNPIEESQRLLGQSTIALPDAIYGHDRRNSCGYDLGNLRQLEQLQQALAPYVQKMPAAPKDHSAQQVSDMLAAAQSAYGSWQHRSADERATMLERAADLLCEHEMELMGLCIREGGKTIPDAIAEIREAVDFCRYYAARTRELFAPRLLVGPTGESNSYHLHGRGVFVCISPWNFPLAIFVGQVAAALAAGNCVIAKPAEQTPAIAARAVGLMHEAGIPSDVLQLACGAGETVGHQLVSDARIAGVAFTGSTAVAKLIQRTLANNSGPIVPLIAETGGQNAMIIDSTALIEQAVDDMIHSAFGSAGQRCSALRVALVHADIADDLLTLLSGAMDELLLGDPANPATDMGPVIDEEAASALNTHIARMKTEAKLVHTVASPALPALGKPFVPPHVFELSSLRQLTHEVFGPVLHVLRYKPSQLDGLLADLNATGYGLTFGVHSRIPAFYDEVCSKVRAGNCYINRGMTGATVGVQPFGGDGLSGTGPKAGGPFTLLRYASERVITNNTAAIGGNIELLMR